MADPEVTVSDKGGTYSPQIFAVDDIETDEVVDETAEPETEPEVEIEGKSGAVEKESDPTVDLRKEIQELKSEILKISARKETAPPPTKEEKEEKLTRSQIVGILKEHKDDPEVLANVIEYLAEQKANSTRDETLKDVNHRQWHTNLSGIANKILHDDEDGYLAANPKVGTALDTYAENLGLREHPVGKLAAYAIMRLSEQVEASVKEKDKPAKAETKSTTRVMDKTRAFDQLDKKKGLTAEQLKVAQKFGVKPETYAKFIRRS